MDGAGRWRRMWHITLPALRPVIALLLVLRVGDALTVGFEQILLQRDAVGPGASEVLDTYVWWNGIRNQDFSYAAAAGLVKGVVGLALVLGREQGRPSHGRAGGVQEVSAVIDKPRGTPPRVHHCDRRAAGRPRRARPGRRSPSRRVSPARGSSSPWPASAILFPLWIVIVTSLSSKKTIDRDGGLVVIPKGITFVAYQELLSGGQVSRAAMVSVGVTARRHAVQHDGVRPVRVRPLADRVRSGTAGS